MHKHKNLKIIIGILVVLLVVLPVLKDLLVKSIVTIAATQITGAPVSIEGFSLGVFKSAVRVKGFKMYNPQGFPNEVMLDVPTVNVDYNRGALLKGNINLTFLELTLKELIVVKNKEGKLNVDSLNFVKQEKKAESGKKAAKEFHIDLFTLDIGRIVYKDLTQEKPAIDVYEVGLKKSYKNINSPQQMAALVLTESMKHTAIQGAAVYGLSSLAGVAFLPVGVAVILTGKGSEQADFPRRLQEVYSASRKAINELGELVRENQDTGILLAKIKGCDVKVDIFQVGDSVRVKVSAKKFLMPRHETAGGLLYQISQNLQ